MLAKLFIFFAIFFLFISAYLKQTESFYNPIIKMSMQNLLHNVQSIHSKCLPSTDDRQNTHDFKYKITQSLCTNCMNEYPNGAYQANCIKCIKEYENNSKLRFHPDGSIDNSAYYELQKCMTDPRLARGKHEDYRSVSRVETHGGNAKCITDCRHYHKLENGDESYVKAHPDYCDSSEFGKNNSGCSTQYVNSEYSRYIPNRCNRIIKDKSNNKIISSTPIISNNCP